MPSDLEALCNTLPRPATLREHAPEMYDTLYALAQYCEAHDTPMGTALLHAIIKPVLMKVDQS